MATGGESECVRLQSCEGETFEVSLRVAKVSRTLATMLEGQTRGQQPSNLAMINLFHTQILVTNLMT